MEEVLKTEEVNFDKMNKEQLIQVAKQQEEANKSLVYELEQSHRILNNTRKEAQDEIDRTIKQANEVILQKENVLQMALLHLSGVTQLIETELRIGKEK